MKKLAISVAILSLAAASAFADTYGRPEVSAATQQGSSMRLRDMPIYRGGGPVKMKREPKPIFTPDGLQPGQADPAAQSITINAATTSTVNAWDGVGVGGNYTPNAAPPDTNGAVGGPIVSGQSSQFVQWVNEAYAVYSTSSGSVIAGPTLGNQLWASFSGPCKQYNDGDPIVQWDKVNRRWIMTQFAVSQGSRVGYRQCVAVSKTEDATGAYNLYEFNYGSNFNDYPKVGVGSDGNYYFTYNMFKSGRSFIGADICAMNGAAMRAGSAATQQCYLVKYGGLLPGDLDGSKLGVKDETVLNFGTNSLNVWSFHADFANTANTKLTGPTSLAVAAFTKACGGGTCIPQPGTTQQLDSLADRMMYRLAYRQLAGYDNIVVTHSVTSNGVAGIRWYELRNSGSGWSVYQQGTYQPDSNYRWMGSAAMDKYGNIIVGYSKSSSTYYPDVVFASRAPGDPLNTLGGETALGPSARGSQSGSRGLTRWGDYASMSVDPADDCTMYFTTEYEKTNGEFNWSTRIGKVKASPCP